MQQQALIGQLQEQHYQQYMSQVYAQQAAAMQNGTEMKSDAARGLADQVAACHLSRRDHEEACAEEASGSDADADSEHSDTEELPCE